MAAFARTSVAVCFTSPQRRRAPLPPDASTTTLGNGRPGVAVASPGLARWPLAFVQMCARKTAADDKEPARRHADPTEKSPGGGHQGAASLPRERQFPHVKEEEQEEDVTKWPCAVKGEDEDGGPGEARGGAEPASGAADALLPPPSDSDDVTSRPARSHDGDDGVDDGGEPEARAARRADNKRWKCSECGNTYAFKSSLKQHMRRHTGEKPYPCSVCGKRFSKGRILTLHMRTHTGEKPFACSVCGQRFSQKGSLSSHARRHTGEKPYGCAFCSKSFSHKRSLTTHTRTHTGEKPFACTLCGKRFPEKGSLKRHAGTHARERCFACADCGQRFPRREALRRHARTHAARELYACALCGNRFFNKGNLTMHTRIHAGERPLA